ncbi:hypothetical protein [Arthrobacter sp. AZCC_0090]|uniref:hypothetical protein n=1 Tax=Arthrobacter sp. AZCC_0090 TaxID=2735881 RepID=UPI00161EE8F0|nr:hypothetical protein [Arthrobacter sp. AZCC_0090]MBB6403204.1 hypothetical protein [Arthrobacter sp. AZCC_0090]
MKKLASRRRHIIKLLIALVVAAFLTLSLPACSQPQAEAVSAADTPATLEEVPGTDLHRITLTERAVERLGLKTGMAASGPQGKLTVPYGAILYDSQGKTWVYTNPELRVYVRQAVSIERIAGEAALLREGPPVGTVVVTLGAEELFGEEFDTAH